ncbi:Oxysterol-binding protein 4 [Dispira simplex]|nr:Oxysterol-binding protein 4 [Dispira simplex]
MTSSDPKPTESPAVEVVDEGDSKVPSAKMGEFYAFLRNLRSFTGDLSALTCPSFLLSGDSILEYCTHWGDQPALFAAIGQAQCSEDRMVAVCRWFISTLYGSYYARVAISNEKKPFNPILGEQLLGSWTNTDGHGVNRLICEQVSHHPPISAVYLENEEAGVMLNGHAGQKSKFTGTTIKVEQTGYVTLHLRACDEVYTLTYPDLYIRSLITGRPFMEIVGISWIQSNQGYSAVFKYAGKPWFGGEYHRFKGYIYEHTKHPHMNPEKLTRTLPGVRALYKIEGRWMAQSQITNELTKTTGTLFDATEHRPVPMEVVPIEEQGPLESRRVWKTVAEAINQGDFGTASACKTEIEERQRALRRDREEKKEMWAPNYFTFIPNDRLPKDSLNHLDPKTQEEGGRWVFKDIVGKVIAKSDAT